MSSKNVEYETIDDATLGNGHTLVLSFARNTKASQVGGTESQILEHDLVFLEVQGTERLSYRPYKVKNDDGEVKDPLPGRELPGASGYQFDRLFDDRGDDIIRVETGESPWSISHFSISALQDNIQVYPRIPTTERQPGWSWASQSEPDPTTGDPYGNVSGKEMRFENPRADMETFAFLSGDKSRVQYGFYNRARFTTISPTLKLEGKTYKVAPITSDARQADELQKALSDDQSARIATWGTISDAFTINLPDDWGDSGAVRRISGPYFEGGNGAHEPGAILEAPDAGGE